ncbi:MULTISPECIES: tRNA pseudouridine(55) synthase TruB [unclassified Kaistella]|uniref:tRNA pseudouridine(55) synthase TruB n=1 Tax=unclassified Kaistella TaxID=2762626 RepID=UPI0027361589|nr:MULTISPECIES: tRNA pseudouridine(55) synthase TruB [unclassified Kaistella]MCZ2083929.1 tRNA pseudouridine(55) synthase TruB [Flavobacteriales bacterium]MDP2454528.1 tRNA pseudouridine(55) synthase TruB [Kaistella sp. SH11-4b]MDP2457266.1 tRNA pseudouridine(55) synthase TruB [Kaistella sp. SH40-3]MDP2460026.1 tRNA pseudouridine(55) synthase TruB [Kaistella sp. SH19-2b]
MTDTDFLEGQIILLDKPLDWTSFQAVNKLKYKLKKEFNLPKKFKIGHAGTLDPRATGLLIVCTGKFTKIIPEIQDAPKEYFTEIKIGVQTESYDTEKPEILQQDISNITEEQIKETLEKFLGEIDQKPPIFSAIKIEGNRAYDLARAGKEVEMKTRKTTINYITDIEIELPFVRFTVGCSKGTYIRSLAHDIGQDLGVGAYLTNLRRTKIGDYKIENGSSDYLKDEYRFENFNQ